jgi:hypothetical protein
MESNKGYWKRQFYMLSSLGLFYVILIALFAIPLVGTFVVILIKGALDLRYFIIAGGVLGLAILGVFIIRALKRLWHRFIRESYKAGEMALRHQSTGQPIEISLLGGLLKFTTGQLQAPEHLSPAHRPPYLLPRGEDQRPHTDIICQLQGLSELKRAGSIDTDEFNLLKGVLIEASATAPKLDQKDGDLLKKTLDD